MLALYDEMHVDIVGGGGFALILCCVCGIRVLCGCVVSCLWCPLSYSRASTQPWGRGWWQAVLIFGSTFANFCNAMQPTGVLVQFGRVKVVGRESWVTPQLV